MCCRAIDLILINLERVLHLVTVRPRNLVVGFPGDVTTLDCTVAVAVSYVPQFFNANALYSVLPRFIIIQSMI